MAGGDTFAPANTNLAELCLRIKQHPCLTLDTGAEGQRGQADQHRADYP